MTKYKIFRYLITIFAVHAGALFLLAIVRVLFFWVNFPEGAEFRFADMLHALVLGVRFDNHGASYVSLLPVVVAFVASFVRNVDDRRVLLFFRIYYAVFFSIFLFLAVTDIRYFSVFGWHINYETLGYMKFLGTTTGMMLEDAENYPYIVLAVATVVLFCTALKWLTNLLWKSLFMGTSLRHSALVQISMLLLAVGVLFIGMRGSFQRYVLKVSFASFSNIPFYNKVGNSAVFNIVETYKQSRKNVDVKLLSECDEEEALDFVRHELSISTADTIKPLTREIAGGEKRIAPNIVLVLMESMTLYNLENDAEGNPLTPFLQNLKSRSYYFENFYSAGIHTNNGICATMYGYTPNFSKPCMNQPSDLYTGLPYELKRNGYETYAFVTSNPQYDNMNSFLRENSIDVLFSQYDYPEEKIVNRFGVRDDYMFEYGVDKLNEVRRSPFFALFLTCSNHSPFSIPEEYAKRFSDVENQAISYADDAVRGFFEKAVKTEWGRNTVFIFVADHGKPRGENPYDMAYYYNRIPCFIYSPMFDDRMHAVSDLGGQIDLFPTIMGLLGFDYQNNTLGVDLFKEKRRYVYFVSDEHLGCVDKEFFYCYNIISDKEFLYRIGNGENLIGAYLEKAAEMKQYAVSMMKINNTSIKKRWINP